MNSNFKNAAVAGKNDSGKRADKIIRTVLSEMNLSSIYKEIRSGKIRINSKKFKPDYRVNEGDIIFIHISILNNSSSEKKRLVMETTPTSEYSVINKKQLDIFSQNIIFENDNIMAVNKRQGIPVHGGDFSRHTETLENCVKNYLAGKISNSITFNPGPLHRLDRNTSGIILFGKSIEGARIFSQMLRTGKTQKFYIALFDGKIENEVRWEDKIKQDRKQKISISSDSDKDELFNGKQSVTIVKPIIYSEKNTLALVNIPTGRYHQIRKQGQINKHPLTGDKKYGGKTDIPGYMLHSFMLVLKEQSEICGFEKITAPLPDYFLKSAGKFFNRNDIAVFTKYLNDIQ